MATKQTFDLYGRFFSTCIFWVFYYTRVYVRTIRCVILSKMTTSPWTCYGCTMYTIRVCITMVKVVLDKPPEILLAVLALHGLQDYYIRTAIADDCSE